MTWKHKFALIKIKVTKSIHKHKNDKIKEITREMKKNKIKEHENINEATSKQELKVEIARN